MTTDKIAIPFINKAFDIVLNETMSRLPIIGQSALGFKSCVTALKCSSKIAVSTSLTKKSMYIAGTACSGAATVCYMGSSAFSVLAPNISLPLLATGEACFVTANMLENAADRLPYLP